MTSNIGDATSTQKSNINKEIWIKAASDSTPFRGRWEKFVVIIIIIIIMSMAEIYLKPTFLSRCRADNCGPNSFNHLPNTILVHF